ncbi:hypothetical protein Tco_1173785 [Tanacetum coccineum]
MHNNIMTAGSSDRPPMLATGRYPQWQSRFLRYIYTRPNGDALRKCILEGPYQPTTVTIPVVPATENSPVVPERTTTAHEMWIAIERLQQGESLNIQDVKTNLFWEFGKFTSHDGESMKSYYSRFYKMMNEMIRNNLTVATMQEVNEIHAERIAKNANPLALVATVQQYPNPYYQAPKSHKSYAPTSKQSSSTTSIASTKFKGKEIAKPITPPSESAYEEDSDPEQAQRDKDMQKNLALIKKYFKKIYKPTNNLRTSSNSKNKNVDTTPSYDISKEKPMSNKKLESKVEDMVEEVKTKMGELFGTYKERFDFLSSNSSMSEHMESEVTSPNNGYNDFLNDYYNVDATSSYETETELDRYLREPKIELSKARSLDILQW